MIYPPERTAGDIIYINKKEGKNLCQTLQKATQ